MIGEYFNQTKTLAHQHHVFAELSLSSKITAMGVAPVTEAAVAFAFLIGESRVDFVIAAVGHFRRLDHATRLGAAVAERASTLTLSARAGLVATRKRERGQEKQKS